MPEEALPPPVLTVPMPGATTAGRYRLVGFEGENDRASLALLSSAMTTGSVDDIRTAGGANVVQRGEQRYYIHSTTDAETLAWAARRFAERAYMQGEAIRHDDIFQVGAGESAHPSMPKLTTSLVARLENTLKDMICRGDGESLFNLASFIEKCWGEHHAALPRLRALTWAARVLGERCMSGDFSKLGESRASPAWASQLETARGATFTDVQVPFTPRISDMSLDESYRTGVPLKPFRMPPSPSGSPLASPLGMRPTAVKEEVARERSSPRGKVVDDIAENEMVVDDIAENEMVVDELMDEDTL